MPLPVCYLNGEYLRLDAARISPLDRGFLFADAAYEVVPVFAGRCFRFREHLTRLHRSLSEMRIESPLPLESWAAICSQVVERNGGGNQYLYLQVSRGMEFGRNHAWPEGLTPTIFAYTNSMLPLAAQMLSEGVAAITAPDIRWSRRDIKSTSLLANVLLKKLSQDAGSYETILLENGMLTEGTSSTVHAIIDGVICTPPNGSQLLPGTTRAVVEELAQRLGIAAHARCVTEAELRGAQEIWLAFSSRGVLPATKLDGAPVGSGRPGTLFARMHAAFEGYVRELAGTPIL